MRGSATLEPMDTTEKIEILVVEDEEAIRRGLCDVIAYHGYEPHGVEDGETGLREAVKNRYAAIILDVMLPEMNGFEVCEGIREKLPQQPVLMLTARGSEEDILNGFRAGCDDYVTKPFSISELVARLEALLRRAGKLPQQNHDVFRFGEWQIDPGNLRATRGEEVLDLSKRELELIALFAREAGRIVSRRMLLQEVWGFASPEQIETRTVDMHIAKLRKKLGTKNGAALETVRGVGYRFNG